MIGLCLEVWYFYDRGKIYLLPEDGMMECKECKGRGYFCIYPQDIPKNWCRHCINGEVPAYREFWLCKVNIVDYAILLRGKKRWYYYDAEIGGWFIVEAEVDPRCRMVQK